MAEARPGEWAGPQGPEVPTIQPPWAPVWDAGGMTSAQLITLITAGTALVVALGHLATDITGTLDKFRRTPIAPPAAPPLSSVPTQPPGGPPAGP